MSPEPITDALQLAEDAILAALNELYPPDRAAWDGAAVDTVRRLRLYARNPADPEGWACCYVAQHQDRGGAEQRRLNRRSWAGLIVVRVLAGLDSEARLGFEQAVAAMQALPQPEGYVLRARWDRPVAIPYADGIYTRAAQWRVTIQRSTP